ncbi:Protein CBG09904 [Caenorhabditis briggsae]|uniref:Protein CBG09904 n=1 Tax=Caenorhabditis briggsae TaxID=6238 RepID=A8X9X8_CAEBR|nr:Protein CBG09904 [Caenorhabditis briggsae]CAP29443.2 Protein CBG09904 [Caenorhabditis briggsae]
MVTLTNVYTEIFKHRKMFSKENLLMLWCFLMIIDLFLEYYLVKMNMMFYIIAGIVYTILIGCIKLESLKGLRFFRALTYILIHEHIYSLELVPAMQILSFGPARPVEQVASVSFTPSSAASLASTTLQHSPAPSTLSPMHTSITFSNSNFSL